MSRNCINNKPETCSLIVHHDNIPDRDALSFLKSLATKHKENIGHPLYLPVSTRAGFGLFIKK